jgi:hypothetical protein
MTKIHLKLGIAVAAAALSFVACWTVSNPVEAGEPSGYPAPSEWDALMDFFEAIAANEAAASEDDAAPTPAAPAPELAAPPAASVEAAIPASDAGSGPASAQPVLLPNTGGRSEPVPGIDLAPAISALLGAGMIISGVAFVRRGAQP